MPESNVVREAAWVIGASFATVSTAAAAVAATAFRSIPRRPTRWAAPTTAGVDTAGSAVSRAISTARSAFSAFNSAISTVCWSKRAAIASSRASKSAVVTSVIGVSPPQ